MPSYAKTFRLYVKRVDILVALYAAHVRASRGRVADMTVFAPLLPLGRRKRFFVEREDKRDELVCRRPAKISTAV